MNPGEAFYLNIADSHRYFVAYSDGNPATQLIIFNFTSYRPGKCDETCIVRASEYTGLDHDSVISYRHGLLLKGQQLLRFQARVGMTLPRIPAPVIERIKKGAIQSPFTPIKIKRLLNPPS